MPPAEVITWSPGLLVASYTLIREIARGGMGEIWLALHRTAGVERLVVIKRIIAGADEEHGLESLFLDEARIASMLSHSNVVQVFDVAEFKGSPYIVMEYLGGQSLGRVVRRAKDRGLGLSPTQAVEIIAGAARGLGYAHRRRALDGSPLNIVHRDVSPQNLLITYEGVVKVLDFGIAQATGRVTRTSTGVVRGKVAYMSPEQTLGERVDPSADVFALGIVLFELLTGTRLHGDAQDLEILRHYSHNAPLPSLADRGPFEPGLVALVDRALAPSRYVRFGDGQVLCEALQGWLEKHGEGVRLEALMQQLFADEIHQPAEIDRAVLMTPSNSAPGRELENGVPTKASGDRGKRATPVAPPRRFPLGGMIVAGLAVVGVASLVWTATHPAGRGSVTPEDAGPPMAVSAPQPASTLVTAVVAQPEPDADPVPAVAELIRAPDAGAVRALATEPTPDAGPAPALATEPTPDAGPAPAWVAQPGRAPDAGPVLAVGLAPDSGLSDARLRRPARAPGRLSLDTDPWTRVWLGGKALGITPLIELPLAAGRHKLRLVNPAERIDTVVEVEIAPNTLVVKRLVL